MGKLRIPASGTEGLSLSVEHPCRARARQSPAVHFVQRFARLFMIPTMYQCNGGYGLGSDLLRPGGERR
jgi:hypothetical protein